MFQITSLPVSKLVVEIEQQAALLVLFGDAVEDLDVEILSDGLSEGGVVHQRFVVDCRQQEALAGDDIAWFGFGVDLLQGPVIFAAEEGKGGCERPVLVPVTILK